jgi:hypothetical protein
LSGRVCYLSRGAGGDRLAGVRLVGVRSDESWEAAGAERDAVGAMEDASAAARWVASRCGRGGVAFLCVDVGGGECAWLTAPGAEPGLVAAALMQEGSAWDASGRSAAWAAPTPAEASVQALAPAHANGHGARARGAGAGDDEGPAGQRLAVLAIPDVSARLLVDALDERGVSVERAASLWHAVTLAWDPARAAGAGSGREVVGTSTLLTAVVLIDPVGRLVWAWSRGGELLAAGTIRLPERREGGAGAAVGAPEVGRLTADWLSWSVQLGEAPSRVVVIGPELSGGDSLSPAMLGGSITRSWPGVSVDLAVHEDPIGATLSRLAGEDEGPEGAAEDGRTALLGLSHRPGRAHRALYRWTALALTLLAAGLIAVAWKAWGRAGEARARIGDADRAVARIVEETAPAPADAGQAAMVADQPRLYLKQHLDAMKQTLRPNAGMPPAKPILAELDALSYVFGIPEVEVTQIALDFGAAVVTVLVPDTATGEAIIASLKSVGDTHVQWEEKWGTGQARADKPNMQQIFFQGKWKPQPGEAPAEPGAGGQP